MSKNLGAAYMAKKRTKKMAKGGDPENKGQHRRTWQQEGVHTPFAGKGRSTMGHEVRGHFGDEADPKATARKTLEEQRAMPKPNLPMAKGGSVDEYKHHRPEDHEAIAEGFRGLIEQSKSDSAFKPNAETMKHMHEQAKKHDRLAQEKRERTSFAEGGPVSAKSEQRPMPTSKGQEEVSRNSGDKAPSKGDSFKTGEDISMQAKKGMRTTPIKHPTMKQSPVFKTKMRDEEDDMMDSMPPSSPKDQPPMSDDELDATKNGNRVHPMKMMAEGGMTDHEDMGHDEMEMEMDHHDSIAAAIMARRDRLHAEIDSGAHDLDEAVKMAEGGEVDLGDSHVEEPNNEDQMSFEALKKENYNSSDLDMDQPDDSNEIGDEREENTSDPHDMVDKIRRKRSLKAR